MKLILVALFFAFSLLAQSAPKVELTWTDAVNPAETTYTVKRATGLCSGTPTFSTVATGLTVKTYLDDTVTAGNYCYVVLAVLNGVESAASNSSQATVPPAPPTNLQTQIK